MNTKWRSDIKVKISGWLYLLSSVRCTQPWQRTGLPQGLLSRRPHSSQLWLCHRLWCMHCVFNYRVYSNSSDSEGCWFLGKIASPLLLEIWAQKRSQKYYLFKTDFHAYYRAQTSSIYISNESSWGIEDRYRGKKKAWVLKHTCRASRQVFVLVSRMPIEEIFLHY